jgi:hypothetical protein
MKKLYYLIVLALILGLVLTGCLLSNVGQVPSTGQSGITYLTKGPLSVDLVDLVGLWHFDEGEGDFAYDSSDYDNDGMIHGAGWVSGLCGSALSFDGSNDYVKVFDSASLNVNDYTIELCINANNFDNVYPTLLNRKAQSASLGYYWIWIKSNYIVLTYTNGSIPKSAVWATFYLPCIKMPPVLVQKTLPMWTLLMAICSLEPIKVEQLLDTISTESLTKSASGTEP